MYKKEKKGALLVGIWDHKEWWTAADLSSRAFRRSLEANDLVSGQFDELVEVKVDVLSPVAPVSAVGLSRVAGTSWKRQHAWYYWNLPVRVCHLNICNLNNSFVVNIWSSKKALRIFGLWNNMTGNLPILLTHKKRIGVRKLCVDEWMRFGGCGWHVMRGREHKHGWMLTLGVRGLSGQTGSSTGSRPVVRAEVGTTASPSARHVQPWSATHAYSLPSHFIGCPTPGSIEDSGWWVYDLLNPHRHLEAVGVFYKPVEDNLPLGFEPNVMNIYFSVIMKVLKVMKETPGFWYIHRQRRFRRLSCTPCIQYFHLKSQDDFKFMSNWSWKNITTSKRSEWAFLLNNRKVLRCLRKVD